MSISAKKCVPCEGGIKKLSEKEAAEMLVKHTPTWQIQENSSKLFREFKFKNYVEAQSFVNKIGEIAEEEQHHPDISFGWGYVKIFLNTHAIGGLHENDFIMASKIDKII